MDRFASEKDKILNGQDADFLLNYPIFLEAVGRVFNKYASVEEDLLTDDQQEVREITAKIKHRAMMRKALLDVVEELKQISIIGKNANRD